MSSLAFRKRDRIRPSKVVGASALSFLLVFGQCAPLLANPTGGAVVAGAATIGAAGSTLTVNQSTASAIINWQTFSIANGEATKFVVPNSAAATLNYVTAANNPSLIYGTLSSNGLLYLINPAGILVGASGRIDTAGFIGSTLNPNNSAFLNGGNLVFSGNSNAAIDNQGVISASSGNVYLIANQVSNEGSLLAPQGNVGLAAGSNVLLAQQGDQHLFVQSNPIGTTRAIGVSNAGTIRAATAELRAAGGNAYALAINNSGSIVATGYQKVNGQVYLTAGTGLISNSGSIRAKGRHHGGVVQLTTTSGTVRNSGTINVSATGTGGVGGSVLLDSPEGEADNTGVILAEGGQGGVGGDVEVSGATLDLAGGVVNTLAPGGTTGLFTIDPANILITPTGTAGTGTFAETGTAVSNLLESSGVQLIANDDLSIDDHITLSNGNTLELGGSTIEINQEIRGDGTLQIDGASGGGGVITTGQQGIIDVEAFILEGGSWSQVVGQNGLTSLPEFTVVNNFEIYDATNSTNPGTASFLRAAGGAGSPTNPYLITDIFGLQGIGSSSTYLGDSFKLSNDISAGAIPNDGGTGSVATWNGGAGFAPIGSLNTPFTGTFNGAGATIDGLTIDQPQGTNVGLFGVLGAGSLVENVNLTNANINGFSLVGALAGANGYPADFAGGTVLAASSSGTVSSTGTSGADIGGLIGGNDGLVEDSFSSATVSDANGGSEIGGLIGDNVGTIEKSYASGAVNSTNGNGVGGLAGSNTGTVSTSSASGTLTGTGTATANFGGLVGDNSGAISDSFAVGDVNAGPAGEEVGGLVGYDSSTASVNGSYAKGAVSGLAYVGGLVGINSSGATILDSYASGPVSGNSAVGGLAGENEGITSMSYATGAVTGTGSDPVSIGGLAGANSGTITQTYATGAVSTGTLGENVGGLVGYNSGSIQLSYAWGAVNGDDNVGGLVGQNAGSVATTYSIGAVTTSTLNGIGGLIGYNGGSVATSYWANNVGSNGTLPTIGDNAGSVDSYTSGESLSSLEAPVTFQPGGTTPPDWDFANTWQIFSNGGQNTTPLLDSLSVTLSGTAVNGLGEVDLIGNGSVLYHSTVEGDGMFTFTVPADAVTSGALLTDPTGNASSTYYIAGVIPNAAITNVDLAASTLTVLGTGVATNHGLGVAAGSLSGDGIDYGVNGSNNLTANAGVGMTIASNLIPASYELDGNITVFGNGLTTNAEASFAAPGNVTLTAPTMSISGDFAGPGALTFTSTSGPIVFQGVGSTMIPAVLGGLTINSAGSAQILNSTFLLSSGGLTVHGTGTNTSDYSGFGIDDGVDISNSTITSYGNIAVTGTGGSTLNPLVSEVVAGYGVDIGASTIVALGTANLAINGVINQTVDSYYGTAGVEISNVGYNGLSGSSSLLSTANGVLSINGSVSGVTVTQADGGNLAGIAIEDGSALAATGTGGAVALIGSAAGSTNTGDNADGVKISGYDSNSDTALVSSVESAGTGVAYAGSITYYGLYIQGTGGTISNSTNGGSASGIQLNKGVNVLGTNAADIALIGQAGTVNNSEDPTDGTAIGVDLSASTINENGTGSVAVTTESGNILIKGTGGSSARLGAGVIIGGLNTPSSDVSATVESTTGNITITGQGATGYTGSGVITGTPTANSVPNFGVAIVDNATIQTGGSGIVTINGSATGLSPDVSIGEAPAGTVDTHSYVPTINTDFGSLVINSTGSGGIDLGADFTIGGATTLTSDANISIVSPTAFDFQGGLNATTTGGYIAIENVGTSGSPDHAYTTSLTASGPVIIDNSVIEITPFGNFTASGHGYTSTSNNNGDPDGIDIFDSTIQVDGGNVTLTGVAGYGLSDGLISPGAGVSIGSDGAEPTSVTTTGSGNITINGLADTGDITLQGSVAGVAIYGVTSGTTTNTSLSLENGLLSITGTVSGTVADGPSVNGSTIGGVAIGFNTELQASGSGSISLTGDTSSSTSYVNGNYFSSNAGVALGGFVSINGGALTITGNAGTLNTSGSTIDSANASSDGENELPSSLGVAISGEGEDGSQNILAAAGSTVTINGTGGSVVTTSAYTGQSTGVFFSSTSNNAMGGFSINTDGSITEYASGTAPQTTVMINGTGSAVNAGYGSNSGDASTIGVHVSGSLQVGDQGSLAVTGTGGSLDISHATQQPNFTNEPSTTGVRINDGASLLALGSAPITINGTGGNVTAGSNTVAQSIGVKVGDDAGSDTTLDVENGVLTINGTGGNSPEYSVGVYLHGFNGGEVELGSASADSGSAPQFVITGTGGSGYVGSGTITGNTVPSSGVLIADNVQMNTTLGIDITGQGGSNSNGVDIVTLTGNTSVDSSVLSPQINGGAVSINSTSGNLLLNGAVDAQQSLTINSQQGSIDLEDTGGNYLESEGGASIFTDDLTVTAPGPILVNDVISGQGNDQVISTNGNITLGTIGQVTDYGTTIDDSEETIPNVLTLAAGTSLPDSHYVINDSSNGSGAISVSGGAEFDIYQADSVSNTLDGITVPPNNVQYGVTYTDQNLPSGNGLLYYVANASDVGPNPIGGSPVTPPPTTPPVGPSTPTTPPNPGPGGGLPPVVIPQNNPNPNGNGDPGTQGTPTGDLAGVWGGSFPPPFSFTGGTSSQTGNNTGGLANSSGNGGLIGAGDSASLGGGGLSNIPGGSNALDFALGAGVHNALSSALTALGGWNDADYSGGDTGDNGTGPDVGGSNEIVIGDGGVVMIEHKHVKTIPLNQAPPQLQNALGNGVRSGLNGGH